MKLSRILLISSFCIQCPFPFVVKYFFFPHISFIYFYDQIAAHAVDCSLLQKNISFFSVTFICNCFILATDFVKTFVFANSTTLAVTHQGIEELFRRHNRQTEWLHIICNSLLKLNRLWGLAHSNLFVHHKKFILSFLRTVTPCCQWGPANFKTCDFHL